MHLTLLEAINDMLLAVRESPINSLRNPLPDYAAIANIILSRVKKDVLRAGWPFNTDYDVTLTRDGNNKITLGRDVLRVEFDPVKNGHDVMPVLRGEVVFNAKAGSEAWNRDIAAKQVIKNLAWEDLPDTARRYITARATRQFVQKVLGASSVTQETIAEEMEARHEFLRDQKKLNRPNILNSPGIFELAYRTRTWL